MIITFYSYKGGVGRTQLVANLAAYLCYYEYRRVLLIDWDLEAPGLHFYFGKNNNDLVKEGVIDMFHKYVLSRRNYSKVSKRENLPRFNAENHIVRLAETHSSLSFRKGSIDLIAAGTMSGENGYKEKLINFNWSEFYQQLDGKRYIEYLKQQLQSLDYDYIFIDSRTGITDYSDICNIQMPEANMMVIAPTNQNVEGCLAAAHQIINSEYVSSGRFRKGVVLPILSRVEQDSPDYNEFFTRFKGDFDFLLRNAQKYLPDVVLSEFDYFKDTTLTYNRFIAIGEQLLFDATRADLFGLARQYSNIAQYLQLIKNPRSLPEVQKNLYGEVRSKSHKLEYFKYFNLAKAFFETEEYERATENFLKVIDERSDYYEAWFGLALTYLKQELYEKAIEAFQKAIELHPDDDQAWYNMAATFRKLGFNKEADSLMQNIDMQNIDIKNTNIEGNNSDTDESYKRNHIQVQQNSNNQRAFDFKQAIQGYHKSIALRPDNEAAFYELASTYSLTQMKEKALIYLQKAIELNPENKEQARHDKSFDWLTDDADFKHLIE